VRLGCRPAERGTPPLWPRSAPSGLTGYGPRTRIPTTRTLARAARLGPYFFLVVRFTARTSSCVSRRDYLGGWTETLDRQVDKHRLPTCISLVEHAAGCGRAPTQPTTPFPPWPLSTITPTVTWYPHGGPRRSIICDYTNAKGAINVANSTCHSGWLCSSLTPTLRLANAAPLSASTHLRALWSSACTCGVSLPSATSSKLLMHRSTPLVEKPRENLAFYRRDVVNHRTAVQRPTSRSSKLVSRRATPSQTRQL